MLLEVVVQRNDANQRADRFIRRLCPQLSLSRLYCLFRKKEIKIQSGPVAKGYLLSTGDHLRIYGLRDFESHTIISLSRQKNEKADLGMPVIYEDRNLLVINKPGNIPVHPGSGVSPGRSVIEKAAGYLGAAGGELFKPSLVHRLDRETSGVLLVAKSGRALRYWTREIREKRIKKTYQALVIGSPESNKDTIIEKLARIDSKKSGAKAVVDARKGRYAKTSYEVVRRYKGYSLMNIAIETGRMHQIRAHLAHAGLPVLGDSRYGDFKANRTAREKFGLRRTFLHALELRGGPPDERPYVFHADLPEDLKDCLKRIGF